MWRFHIVIGTRLHLSVRTFQILTPELVKLVFRKLLLPPYIFTMPRQSRGRPAPSRHSAPAPAQTRSASTQNVPARTQQAPPPAVAAQQSSGPGMFGNMMSTAAGVGIGSAIGHSIGSLFTGGSSHPAPEQQAQQQPTAYDSYGSQAAQSNNAYSTGISCEADAKQFTKCLEATNNDMNSCSYYLDALKQCQAMARNA